LSCSFNFETMLFFCAAVTSGLSSCSSNFCCFVNAAYRDDAQNGGVYIWFESTGTVTALQTLPRLVLC
jgi:hypothetical protein